MVKLLAPAPKFLRELLRSNPSTRCVVLCLFFFGIVLGHRHHLSCARRKVVQETGATMSAELQAGPHRRAVAVRLWAAENPRTRPPAGSENITAYLFVLR